MIKKMEIANISIWKQNPLEPKIVSTNIKRQPLISKSLHLYGYIMLDLSTLMKFLGKQLRSAS